MEDSCGPVLAVVIIIGVILLRVLLVLDESNTLRNIIFVVGGLFLLLRFIDKWQSDRAAPKLGPRQKRAVLVPMEHKGKTYAYLEDMPFEVRAEYNSFVSALMKASPTEVESFLLGIKREDLISRLKKAQEMLDAGLITEEDYIVTKKQILTYRN